METHIKKNISFIKYLIEEYDDLTYLTKKQIESVRIKNKIKPQPWIYNEKNLLRISRGKYNFTKIKEIYHKITSVNKKGENSGFLSAVHCSVPAGIINGSFDLSTE